MYRNDGGGVFTKADNAITRQAMQVLGISAADFDNDGRIDPLLRRGPSYGPELPVPQPWQRRDRG